jgi:hypothetical protein
MISKDTSCPSQAKIIMNSKRMDCQKKKRKKNAQGVTRSACQEEEGEEVNAQGVTQSGEGLPVWGSLSQ